MKTILNPLQQMGQCASKQQPIKKPRLKRRGTPRPFIVNYPHEYTPKRNHRPCRTSDHSTPSVTFGDPLFDPVLLGS